MRVHDGRLFLLTVVVAALVVAFAGRAALRRRAGAEGAPPRDCGPLRGVLVVLVVGIAAVASTAAARRRRAPRARTAREGARRLVCGSSDARLDWWKEAWQSFEDEPLDGTGAASFQLAHRLHRAEFTRPVTEPHNFALQDARRDRHRRLPAARGRCGASACSRCGGGFVTTPRSRSRSVRSRISCTSSSTSATTSSPSARRSSRSLGVLLADVDGAVARREPVWAVGGAGCSRGRACFRLRRRTSRSARSTRRWRRATRSSPRRRTRGIPSPSFRC